MEWSKAECIAGSDSEILPEDTGELFNDNETRIASITPSNPLIRIDDFGTNAEHSAFCSRCRAISCSLLRGSLAGTPSNCDGYSDCCRYEESVQQYFSVPAPADDVPLLNDDLVDVSNDRRRIPYGREITVYDDHCHLPKNVGLSKRRAITKLCIACVLTSLFMVSEVIGGYLANSIAIMSDAAHMFSDLTSFLVSLVAICLAKRPASRNMSFGYYRAEVLGALVSVLMIWVVTGVLVYAAIQRVISMEFEVHADIMIIVSAVGVAMNIILGFVLHSGSGGHGHSHGARRMLHAEQSQSGQNHTSITVPDRTTHTTMSTLSSPQAQSSIREANGSGAVTSTSTSRELNAELTSWSSVSSSAAHSGSNINVRAAFIHVVGDLLQSIGVLIAAYIIRFYPEYKIADPICTFAFSVVVIFTTLPILRDLGHVLMEAVPPGVDYAALNGHLTALPGVRAVHSLHVWALTVDKNALSVHIAVGGDVDGDAVLKAAQRVIRNKHHIFHTTIQVERYNAVLMENCHQCQPIL